VDKKVFENGFELHIHTVLLKMLPVYDKLESLQHSFLQGLRRHLEVGELTY
jgi:hypothetical protein